MPTGSIQTVIVCTPVMNTPPPAVRSLCPDQGTQMFAPVGVQAYVIDPSQQGNFEAATEPFDYGYASGIWSLAFSMIVGLYFVSQGIGSALGVIRRG